MRIHWHLAPKDSDQLGVDSIPMPDVPIIANGERLSQELRDCFFGHRRVTLIPQNPMQDAFTPNRIKFLIFATIRSSLEEHPLLGPLPMAF